MYYASIGILASLILLINNYDILIISSKDETIPAHKTYKLFLLSVLTYYIIDAIWELPYALKLNKLTFLISTLYFIVMATSVLMWTKYVIAYLNEKNKFSTFLKMTGWLLLIGQIIVLILNFFLPLSFWFDDTGFYHTSIARAVFLAIQVFIFYTVTIYMAFIARKTDKVLRRRHKTIGFFSFVMASFIFLQIFFPFTPFYAIGYMLGTCLLHTFVLADEKEAHRKQMENIMKVEELQEFELVTTRRLAYTDPLTGVKNKMAYIDDVGSVESRIENNELSEFAIVVFDLNDLKTINDTKGHDAGDQYIKTAAAIISEQFKHSPVYRIGGDEFVAILRDKDYKNHIEILKSFNAKMEENVKTGDIVISCGFSEFIPHQDKSLLRIFERADKRMYERKKLLKELKHQDTSSIKQ